MRNCKKCESLMEKWDDGTRWVLTNETQVCIWDSRTDTSEVDIQDAESFAYYCCEAHALEGIKDHLLQISAEAKWSDVRPIESCACCNADFDTTRPHKVLVLSRDVVDGDDVQLFDINYPARFCNKCVPC